MIQYPQYDTVTWTWSLGVFQKHYMEETNWRLKVTYLNCSSQVASLKKQRTKEQNQPAKINRGFDL